MGHFTRDIEPDGAIYNNHFVARLTDAGFTQAEAMNVLTEAYTMDTDPESARLFERHFRDENGDVDVAKVNAMAHIQNVRMTADSMEPVLEQRAESTDLNIDGEALKDVIELMHAQGKSAEQIKNRIERYVKIAKASTPHPTEHLSPEGIDLNRGLAAAAEEDKEQRPEAIKNKLGEMAESDNFAAAQKADIVDEADNSNAVARIHNKGANELDRELEAMIYEVTGEHVDVDTNTGPKSWDYDADGKPNADGFAMMMKISTTSMGAFEDTVQNLDAALQSKRLDQRTRFELQNLKENIEEIMERLKPVYERSRQITRELAAEGDADKRWEMYEKFHKEEFEKLFSQLEGLYDGVDPDKRGLDFYRDTLESLDNKRKHLIEVAPEAAMALDSSCRDLKRNGFALEKGQTRHNDLVYKEMLDKFFASEEFDALGILNEEDKALIAQKGTFSKMKHEDEYAIMQKVLAYADENGNREEITAILEKVNPLQKGKNGYPDQTASYTDRMRLRGLFPYKFEEGVISDSGAFGSPRQKFIADLYGIENMKHMSLYEDRPNLSRQGKLTSGTYKPFGGEENLVKRRDKFEFDRRDVEQRMIKALHMMRPASDAERAGGSFTRLEAIKQYREAVRDAYNLEPKIPIEVMIGGGQSLNRFGADVDMVRRILAQELKEIFMEKKEKGEPLEGYDHDMMIMASSVLYTEQGRTKRILSATPGQVRDGLMKKTTNILKDLMDLKGEVEDYTFIDQRKKFSPQMERVQENIWKRGIEDYAALNQTYKKDEHGKPTEELVLDGYAAEAGPMEMVGKQNFGSRPASGKASGDKQDVVSGFRAIGKDQTLYSMQSFHAGFYGAGTAMANFHHALNEGDEIKQITLNDIKDLMQDDDWDEAIFSRNLIDAARFNATHLAKELFGEEEAKEWDHDRLMALGKLVQPINAGKNEKGEDMFILACKSSENVTQEQMYFAKIYYDRARFLAFTEASLAPNNAKVTMKSSEQKILDSIKPESGLEITLGKRTQERWPTIMEKTISDHKLNAPLFSLNNMVDKDIRYRKERIAQKMEGAEPEEIAKAMKENIDQHYGNGDASMAEKVLRGIASALRAGTLPHKDKWMGKDSIGLKNRRRIEMQPLIAHTYNMNGRGRQPEAELA